MKLVGTSICTFSLAVLLAACGSGGPDPDAQATAAAKPAALTVQFQSDPANTAEITAYSVVAAGTAGPSVSGMGMIRPGNRSLTMSLGSLGDSEAYELDYRFRPLSGQTSCSKRADACEGTLPFTAEQAASGEPIPITIPPESGE